MKKNLGSFDRGLRAVIGIAIIGWGYYASSWWGAIGLVPLATAMVGTCGLYLPFGINTCKVKEVSK